MEDLVAFSDQLCVQFRLANFCNRDVSRNTHAGSHFTAETLDILTFLANHNTRTCRMYGDAGGFRRPFNLDTAYRCLCQSFLQIFPDRKIRVQHFRIFATLGVPS